MLGAGGFAVGRHAHPPTAHLAATVNTPYLYGMASRLVNVRLDEERVRKARALRARGVSLSAVVREAIDDRYAAIGAEARRDVRAIVQVMFERHPDPPGLGPRRYDVHDRRAARRAIQRRLRRAAP
jgi:hypothetical protein